MCVCVRVCATTSWERAIKGDHFCVLPVLPQKRSAAPLVQNQPRAQRRHHLDLDANARLQWTLSPSPAIIVCGKRRQLNDIIDALRYCVMCGYRRFWVQNLRNAALPPSRSITQCSIAFVDKRKYLKYYWCRVLLQALVVADIQAENVQYWQHIELQ